LKECDIKTAEVERTEAMEAGMELPKRTTDVGDAWWKKLSKGQKMDAVRPLIDVYQMSNGQIQKYLELSGPGMIINARSNIKYEKAGTKPQRTSEGGDPGTQGKRSPVITLAGNTLGQKKGLRDSIFPEPTDDCTAEDIRAIDSFFYR